MQQSSVQVICAGMCWIFSPFEFFSLLAEVSSLFVIFPCLFKIQNVLHYICSACTKNYVFFETTTYEGTCRYKVHKPLHTQANIETEHPLLVLNHHWTSAIKKTSEWPARTPHILCAETSQIFVHPSTLALTLHVSEEDLLAWYG